MFAMRRILLSAILVVAVSVPAYGGDPENGKSVYLQHGCYSCHGYNGIGRHQLIDGASGIMSNETLFVQFLRLRADQNPLGPSNRMPNYSVESLSDAAAKDVYSYIKTLTDASPPLEEIEALMLILDATEKEKSVDAKR